MLLHTYIFFYFYRNNICSDSQLHRVSMTTCRQIAIATRIVVNLVSTCICVTYGKRFYARKVHLLYMTTVVKKMYVYTKAESLCIDTRNVNLYLRTVLKELPINTHTFSNTELCKGLPQCYTNQYLGLSV